MSSAINHNTLSEGLDAIKLSGDIVRHGLGIDKHKYTLLLTRLQTQMNSLGLLGERLNTTRAKALLRQGFTAIYREFDHIFHNVPDGQRKRCLTFMAQRCNYNKRRRLKSKRISREVEVYEAAYVRTLSASDTSPPSHTDDKRRRPLKTIQNTMVQVCRPKYRNTSCRPQDLLAPGSLKDTITVDDLDFRKFIALVARELAYNEREDIIVYERAGVVDMNITNELEWRAALEEMRREGSGQMKLKDVKFKLLDPLYWGHGTPIYVPMLHEIGIPLMDVRTSELAKQTNVSADYRDDEFLPPLRLLAQRVSIEVLRDSGGYPTWMIVQEGTRYSWLR
ncbi:MAG: hypothetical protein M1830_004497 [Pleopsidium flavum]|nr:MAG: hypothetical protein M1830_004497 [Pleopsidium flavum]